VNQLPHNSQTQEQITARRAIFRQLRMHLESLRSAGLEALPLPKLAVSLPPEGERPGGDRLSIPLVSTGERPPLVLGSPVLRDREDAPRAIEATVAAATAERPDPANSGSFHTPQPARPASLVPGAGSLFADSGFDRPPLPPEQKSAELHAMAEEVATCRKCPVLAANRTQTVFADGSPNARLMLIGEAPGADEDRLGLPFVGRAGQLLTDMIEKGMGLRREDVYIANILKCRPPGNREPSLEEAANCRPFLERQIEIVRPELLCLLGRVAAQNLLETTLSMSKLRGIWHTYRGIPTLVTYHPAYLLRNPASKRESWQDLQMLMRSLGLQIPRRGRG
jgi:uracil-DNA glycosylase family 4